MKIYISGVDTSASVGSLGARKCPANSQGGRGAAQANGEDGAVFANTKQDHTPAGGEYGACECPKQHTDQCAYAGFRARRSTFVVRAQWYLCDAGSGAACSLCNQHR